MSDDIKKPTSEQMLVQNCARGLRNGVVKPDWADALLNYVRHLEIEAASCATLRVDRDIKAEHAALWQDACKQRDEENARLRAENERLTKDAEINERLDSERYDAYRSELATARGDAERLVLIVHAWGEWYDHARPVAGTTGFGSLHRLIETAKKSLASRSAPPTSSHGETTRMEDATNA